MSLGRHRYDVVIVGAGVTGLLAAGKLSNIGLKVAIVERHDTLASGPSTRNEGWLHRGTYHARSINDRRTAIQVAARCIYGHNQIRSIAPEAIEGGIVQPVALLRDENWADELVSRWNVAGVKYKPITKKSVNEKISNADLSDVAVAYEVGDVSINTRLLYRKLHTLAVRAGCRFFLGQHIASINQETLLLGDGAGCRIAIQAEKFIHAAGTGTRDIFEKFFAIKLPIRFWKSHLVITDRLADPGLFFLDPHEAAMMHHGTKSIVGLNEDAFLCQQPDYDVVEKNAVDLRAAIRRLFPSWSSLSAINIACVKVDLIDNPADARSLDIAIREPVSNHICILPGKMTEAPYLTDILTSRLHDMMDLSLIALRPCDHHAGSVDIVGAA